MNKHILALLALAALLTGCSKEPPQNLTPFTSKTTGQSIFLPAAGTRISDRLTGAGTYGHYWTSTLNETNPYNAYKLNVNPDTARTSDDNRFAGLSIRPVYAAPAE